MAGSSPDSAKSEKDKELGMIAIDSLYSPVRTVGLKVEAVRVGEITDYDKLILTVETDGTVNPRDTVISATKMLLDHFQLFMNLPEFESASPKKRKKAVKEEESEEKEEKPKKAKKKK